MGWSQLRICFAAARRGFAQFGAQSAYRKKIDTATGVLRPSKNQVRHLVFRSLLEQPSYGEVHTRLSGGAYASGESDGSNNRFRNHAQIKRAADHDCAGIVEGAAGFVPSAPIDFSSD